MTGDHLLTDHEDRDVNSRLVIGGGCGLLLGVVIVLLLMQLLVGLFATEESVDSVPQTPPEPRLQASPAQNWLTVKATQEAILNTYDWVDRTNGVAHIPIDRAMELIVTEYAQTPEPTGDAHEQE